MNSSNEADGIEFTCGVKNLQYPTTKELYRENDTREITDIEYTTRPVTPVRQPKLALGGKAVCAGMGRKCKSGGAQPVTVSHRLQ